MSDFREEAERIADELHCEWFDREDGIEIIEAALKKTNERGRREGLLKLLGAIPKQVPSHPHTAPEQGLEDGCDVCVISVLIASHMQEWDWDKDQIRSRMEETK